MDVGVLIAIAFAIYAIFFFITFLHTMKIIEGETCLLTGENKAPILEKEIIELWCIIWYNAYGLWDLLVLGMGLYPTLSLMNHSWYVLSLLLFVIATYKSF